MAGLALGWGIGVIASTARGSGPGPNYGIDMRMRKRLYKLDQQEIFEKQQKKWERKQLAKMTQKERKAYRAKQDDILFQEREWNMMTY